MKRNKYIFVLIMLVGIALVCAGLTRLYLSQEENEKNDRLTIVTSFYPVYIATSNIVEGIDGIELKNLSEPQTGCLHDFQLTPEDMKLLSKADIFVINGGEIEGFMSDVRESYPGLSIVEASEGIKLLSDEEEENAHAWLSVDAYMKQVDSIANQLATKDIEHKDAYMTNAKKYLEKLKTLSEKQLELKELTKGENIVILHEAFFYVASDYGMNVCGLMDLDEERQISAGEVADIISAINDNNVSVILVEEQYGADMGATLEKETNARVVYINPLNRGDYNIDSYIKGMSENIELLYEVFSGKE